MGGHHATPESVGHAILKLTYVTYPNNGVVGKLAAIVTLSPMIVFAALVGAFVATQNIEILFLAKGLLLSTLCNETFKRIVQQPRPEHSTIWGYGMPSDHSQFMAFFAAFSVCWIHYRDDLALSTNTASRKQLNKLTKRFLTSVLILWSLAVVWSRLYLNAHTIPQVRVGAMLGTIAGTIWFRILQRLLPLVSRWQKILDERIESWCYLPSPKKTQ